MRQRKKPIIQRSRRISPHREVSIVPFFTDEVPVNEDLYRFVFPEAMTLVRAVVRIDKMLDKSLLLNGGIQSEYKKTSLSQSVKLGVNIFEFDIPGNVGDILVLRFDDSNLTTRDISGITVSLVMKL